MPPKRVKPYEGEGMANKKISRICQDCGERFKSVVKVHKSCARCAKLRSNGEIFNGPKKQPPVRKPKPQVAAPPQGAKTSRTLKGARDAPSMSTRRALAQVGTSSSTRAIDNVAIRASNQRKTAVSRLMMAQLDCRATQGQQPVLANVDATLQPKLSYQYDTLFTIRAAAGTISPLKIRWIASPVYACELWSPIGFASYQISGASTIEVAPTRLYVLGNKTGFVGTVDVTTFNASPDWSRYRAISVSGVCQWAGRAIDKNGFVNIARMTDSDEIATFEPQTKADAVSLNFDEPFSVSAQHTQPTLNWNYVDPNDALIEGHAGTPLTELIGLATLFGNDGGFIPPASNLGQLSFQALPLGTAITNALLGNTLQAVYGLTTANNTLYLSNILAALDNKWNIHDNGSPPNTFFLKSIDVSGRCLATVAGLIPSNGVVQALSALFFTFSLPAGQYTSVSLNTGISLGLFTAFAGPTVQTTTGVLPPVNLGMKLEIRINFTSNNIGGDGVQTKFKIPRSLTDTVAVEEGSGYFIDPEWISPVAQFEVDDIRMQVYHQAIFELMVEDTSPFTEMALAASDASGARAISKSVFDRYEKSMKGMPPALSLSEQGLTHYAESQLASRGVLSDVIGLLGSAAGAILPGARPLISNIQNIAGSLEGMFI